jgi:hypothetical protein
LSTDFDNIASILRSTKRTACIEKAIELEQESVQTSQLHLRNLSLTADEIKQIATAIKSLPESMRSISFSYNREIGDKGAIALAASLPLFIQEIGLVDCGIGDDGANAVLKWMNTSTHLQMICIEQNPISEKTRIQFQKFIHPSNRLAVYV